jgi:CheY-like chemotaxis protein
VNTKKVILISSDSETEGIIKMSALTLTKLNCQIAVEVLSEMTEILQSSSSPDLDLIIIDSRNEVAEPASLIAQIRKEPGSGTKKILFIFDQEVNRESIFEAGCDSIMSKAEFKRVVNNILTM